MIICEDRRNLQKDKHHCNTPPIWALWRCGQTQSSPQCSVRSVFASVPCSCFHVFYFKVELWFLFGSCFPCPHVSLPLVPLFIVSYFHWLFSCHVIISSVCSLVGSCHVSSRLLQVAMSLAVSQYQVRKIWRLWVQFPGNTHTDNMYSLNAL